MNKEIKSMEFDFYIFGTPENFEIYNKEGKLDKITPYFQRLNKESKVHTELFIERRRQRVFYSFLCYDLVSVKGESGSFFGMSLVFSRKYCAEIESLYELFEQVYQKIIIEKGILLKKNNDNTISYCTGIKDENAKIEGNAIEGIIRKNIEQFNNDFKQLDSNSVNSVKIKTMPPINKNIKAVMKNYSKISVSPDYQGKSIKNNKVEKRIQIQQEKEQKKEEMKPEKAEDIVENETLQNNETLQEKKEIVEAKPETENTVPGSQKTETNQYENQEKPENIFKSKWMRFLFIVAVIATIGLIISIYEIVRLWL